MASLFFESPFALFTCLFTGKHFAPYPEEVESFVLPDGYMNNEKGSLGHTPPISSTVDEEKTAEIFHSNHPREDLIDDDSSEHPIVVLTGQLHSHSVQADIENLRTFSIPITPKITKSGDILVDWYTTDDPANPQNWTTAKKCAVTAIICSYTFAVYAGSSIYTPAEEGIMEYFDVSLPVASLGLAMYVLGYGMGPLIFSPLSEVPSVGRSLPYAVTFAIYVILCVPTALVDNIAGLIVLRFLQGFFGSPCLATAPATFQDMFPLLKLPYSVAIWTSFSFCGPALGPVLSGYAVVVKGWRWSMWEILWMAAPCFIAMLFFLPETSAANILLRRAQRLRKLTGDYHLRSQSEIDQGELKLSIVVYDALIKPIQICMLDPAVLFVNLYTSIVYGIYYSFFEAFPLVYGDVYHFNIGEVSTTYICIFIACIIGVTSYMCYLGLYLIPNILKNGLRAQEHRLQPALIAVFFPTIGLFIFGWSSRADIHWIVSIIGITLYSLGVFIILQCIFTYIPLSYPTYAASLFAANDFCRSALAAGSVMFAHPLYVNLGIDKGVTLLAGLSVIGIIGMYFLYFFGAKLRSRSKFAIK